MPERLRDQQLLVRISESDEAAFREIFDHYHSKIYAQFHSISKSRAVADKLLTDVFISIWVNRSVLPEIRHLGNFMYRMGCHKTFNFLQQAANDRTLCKLIWEEIRVTAGDVTNNKLVAREMQQLLDETVAQLPPQRREIFRSGLEDDMPHDQVAAHLRFKNQAAKKRPAASPHFIDTYLDTGVYAHAAQADQGKQALLFQKYIHNTCTEQELDELLAFVGQMEQKEALQPFLQQHWDNNIAKPAHNQLQWQALHRRLLAVMRADTAKKTTTAFGKRQERSVFVAIVVLLLLAGGFCLYVLNPSTNNQLSLTPASQVRYLSLPDGSKVALSAGSSLAYPEVFSGNNREVTLRGEAYFEIVEKKQQPFMVHTGQLGVNTEGSVFNIRARLTEPDITVTVANGKVQVLEQGKPLAVLGKNRALHFHKASRQPNALQADAWLASEWKDGNLFLKDRSFDEIARLIGSRYNMDVEFSNEAIRNCHCTATFSSETTLDHLLSEIQGLTHVSYSQRGGKIILSGKGCL